jgi:hypothetical protein
MLGGRDQKEWQNGYLLFVVHDWILCWIRGPLSSIEAC